MQLVTYWLVNSHLRYEKSNVIEWCRSGRSPDAGIVWELTGDDHNHDASDHGHGSPATSRYAHDDNYHAHGRRLLIPEVRRGSICCSHGPVGRLRIQKQH